MTDRTRQTIELLQKAIEYQREQFDGEPDMPLEVSGADMVDWFTEFRNEAHSLLRSMEYDAERNKKEEEQAKSLENTGKCAMSALAEMVAALECDYDRLEELRATSEELPEGYKLSAVVSGWIWTHAESNTGSDRFDTDKEATRAAWEHAFPDEAEELKELKRAAGDCPDREEAEQRIHEDPLSIEVRSDWVSNKEEMEPAEFKILLATGGPAVRIIGELDQYKQPSSARLQVQDWFTPWTEYVNADSDTLLTYCRCFYFGE